MKLPFALFVSAAILAAQTPKPETTAAFESYVRAAEGRMQSAERFLDADANPALKTELVKGGKVLTSLPNGANPHKLPGGMLYDWVASVFIPGTSVERVVRMLQDYDHRAQYFPEIISTSKLLCRSGDERFGFSM